MGYKEILELSLVPWSDGCLLNWQGEKTGSVEDEVGDETALPPEWLADRERSTSTINGDLERNNDSIRAVFSSKIVTQMVIMAIDMTILREFLLESP